MLPFDLLVRYCGFRLSECCLISLLQEAVEIEKIGLHCTPSQKCKSRVARYFMYFIVIFVYFAVGDSSCWSIL